MYARIEINDKNSILCFCRVNGCFVPINARTGAIGAFLLCCLSLSCKESAIFVFAGDSSYRLGLHRAVWDTLVRRALIRGIYGRRKATRWGLRHSRPPYRGKDIVTCRIG